MKEFDYEILMLEQSKIFTKNCHIIPDNSNVIVAVKTIRNKDRSIKKKLLGLLFHFASYFMVLINSLGFFLVILLYKCIEKNFPLINGNIQNTAQYMLSTFFLVVC